MANTEQQIAAQKEMEASFLFALDDFIAKLNFIDGNTPGGSDIPPSWWLELSKLRRACYAARAAIKGF
jgi:hypothetical protein